ncbi:MAG: aspartyl-tRNA(Asn)/glutamyl-tRNA(Gln) amidotransferase subunit A [Myxococcota bacterium]|jgi:aspartyl-tRNA(Asn)/glutamyl-tRNA(Gln) amidotransferase subunit A
MSELITKSATALAAIVKSGEASAREVVDAHLARIEQIDGSAGYDKDAVGATDVHAFLTVTSDAARAQADSIDAARARGDQLPVLAGVPLATKDLFVTKGVETTASSKILKGWIPPYDSTVVSKLREAGTISLGKVNMDEFAMGSSTETSAYGVTRNPWDLGRVPGGSSGGSVAAVSGHMTPLAAGTDTGGSIRQPAALTGTVGMKPTYGRISRWGMVAFASSLDQAGPIARTVEDCALMYTAMAGHDPKDSTSLPYDVDDVLGSLKTGIKGLRIGVVTELSGEGYESGVSASFTQALARLESLGAEIVEVSLPHAPYGLPAYYLVAPSEASSNLARYDGTVFGTRVDAPTSEEMNAATRAAGFGPEVKRRIMIGTYALSAGYYDAYYNQASRIRTLIANDFKTAWESADLLVSPSSPGVAFEFGSKSADPIAMYLNDVATVPASLAGIPAMSIPSGLNEQGLPVGLQIMAPLLREDIMLRAAWAFEQATGFDTTPRGAHAVTPPGGRPDPASALGA